MILDLKNSTFKNWLQKIACEKNLQGADYRVLFVLLAKADSESKSIYIAQSEIAEILEIERSQVYRAIKRLAFMNVIEKKLIAGKLVGYRFLIEPT